MKKPDGSKIVKYNSIFFPFIKLPKNLSKKFVIFYYMMLMVPNTKKYESLQSIGVVWMMVQQRIYVLCVYGWMYVV